MYDSEGLASPKMPISRIAAAMAANSPAGPPVSSLFQPMAELGLGMLPGSGDVMAMQESQEAGQKMADAWRAGDYGKAASSGIEATVLGLGALPMVPALGSMIKAWHGSPHVFDAFDISRIGTGEGAQAYGHGLYFAENPKIAGYYRDALTKYGERVMINGKAAANPTEMRIGLQVAKDPAVIDRQIKEIDQMVSYLREQKAAVEAGTAKPMHGWGEIGTTWTARDEEYLADRLNELDNWKSFKGKNVTIEKDPGALYNVTLDVEPEDLLDWDAPLSQQSEKVRKAVEIVGAGRGKLPKWVKTAGGYELYDDKFGRIAFVRQEGETVKLFQSKEPTLAGQKSQVHAGTEFPSLMAAKKAAEQNASGLTTLTGKSAYKLLSEQLGSGEAASRALAEAGIPGLRYFDAGSRGSGDGTRNVVMFTDKGIKIEGRE